LIVDRILRNIVDIKNEKIDNYSVYELVVGLFDASLVVLEASKSISDVVKRMQLRHLGL